MDNDIAKNYYAEVCICSELPALQILQAGKFEKLSFNQSQNLIYGFSIENGRIIYNGSEEIVFTGFLLARVRSEEPSDVAIKISKNGIQQEINGGLLQAMSDYKTINGSFEVLLFPNDYLEINLTKTQGTGIVQVKELKFTVSRK